MDGLRRFRELLVKTAPFIITYAFREPKQNINPRLVEQYDSEHGGALTSPPPKTPKAAPKRAAKTPSQVSTPARRSRPRAPPKPRDEIRKLPIHFFKFLF